MAVSRARAKRLDVPETKHVEVLGRDRHVHGHHMTRVAKLEAWWPGVYMLKVFVRWVLPRSLAAPITDYTVNGEQELFRQGLDEERQQGWLRRGGLASTC